MPRSRLDVKELESHIAGLRPEFETTLGQLVEIPTVSMDPAHKTDMRDGAAFAVELLRSIGAEARAIETPLHPVVVGQLIQDPSYPTLTLYNHLDVQPADREKEGWTHEPFRFTVENDKFRGRGATDDKGPALTAFYAIRYAVEHGIPLNFKFLWEMEEEIGSPSFAGVLKDNAAELTTDSVVVSDTIWISRTRPATPYGLRGVQSAMLRLETGAKDVHSGLTGGAARNPLTELMDVVTRCVDARTGKIKIPGFHDDVARPTKKELDSFERSGFSAAVFKKAHELRSLRSNDRRDLVQRIWSRPTFEVHGVSGGYSGAGVKTVVPGKGEIKVSMRLVPNQKPAKILKQLKSFVKKINPDVKVVGDAVLEPYLGDFSGPYNDAAGEAMKFGFGRQPAFIREGGSIGAVVSMERAFKAPITFLGLSLPEHGYHAPNEHYDWGQAAGGVRMFVRYFELASEMG